MQTQSGRVVKQPRWLGQIVMNSKIERVGKPEEPVKEEWKSSETKTCYIITVHSSLAKWRFDVCINNINIINIMQQSQNV